MRSLKVLLASAAVCTALAFAPTAKAQISLGINIGGPPPSCQWGYYEYSPYACAPPGYYGQGYFYNGIFLGVGPWSNWGYNHGWGGHRFNGARGGRYNPGHRGGGDHNIRGGNNNRGNNNRGGRPAPARNNGGRPGAPNKGGHASPPHGNNNGHGNGGNNNNGGNPH